MFPIRGVGHEEPAGSPIRGDRGGIYYDGNAYAGEQMYLNGFPLSGDLMFQVWPASAPVPEASALPPSARAWPASWWPAAGGSGRRKLSETETREPPEVPGRLFRCQSCQTSPCRTTTPSPNRACDRVRRSRVRRGRDLRSPPPWHGPQQSGVFPSPGATRSPNDRPAT